MHSFERKTLEAGMQKKTAVINQSVQIGNCELRDRYFGDEFECRSFNHSDRAAMKVRKQTNRETLYATRYCEYSGK